MSKSSEAVLERARVREAAGVFRQRHRLDAAADDLLAAGFDRGDIDVMAGTKSVIERLGDVYIAAEDLADMPSAPRSAFLGRAEIIYAMVLIPAILMAFAGIGAGWLAVQSNGTWLEAAMAATAGTIVAGGVGVWLSFRLFRRRQTEERLSAASFGGLILWVRVRSPEQEEEAQRILRCHGAKAVRVHEIDLEKRPDDLPLASLRTDPWLGGERIGHL